MKVETSSFVKLMTQKEREALARGEMFQKAKRLEGSDDEKIEGVNVAGNIDGGFNDDDWN